VSVSRRVAQHLLGPGERRLGPGTGAAADFRSRAADFRNAASRLLSKLPPTRIPGCESFSR
jgi:hypothetical protein